MFRVALVPVDHSSFSACAARHALDLSRLLGCRVVLAHILPDDAPDVEAARAEALSLLNDLARGARLPPRLRLEEAEGRSVPQAIVDAAQAEGADLVVVGTRGRGALDGPLEGLVLGSVAHEVAARAGVPVQIIPPRGDEAAGSRWIRAARGEVTPR